MKHKIRINKWQFLKFNGEETDRFGFFREEENRKIQEYDRQFDRGTAYNYHRLNNELDTIEWRQFYREMSDQLFQQYNFLVVQENGEIFGVKNRTRKFLLNDPDAYSVALHVSKQIPAR
jgi:hypothetical protein